MVKQEENSWKLNLGSKKRSIALLGGSGPTGECLLPLLTQAGRRVVAFSRQARQNVMSGVEWQSLSTSRPKHLPHRQNKVKDWICAAPVWALPDYFHLLEESGAQRLVALSSTSRFTKSDSSDSAERIIAQRLIAAETQLQEWAEKNGIEWIILRPTLIYGRGRDKNIAEIARFVHRFGFFPLLGKAEGLRQPIHVEDVAAACLAALKSPKAANRAYNISGGATLPYREMVRRIFTALHQQPRMVTVPLTVFKSALACLRLFPEYRSWSVGMAARMNRDMVFDHSDAARDFGFSPRPFQLTMEDIPHKKKC